MLLALTRCLFPATACPLRDPSSFDTFVWVTQVREIPIGCVVFTDGSLLDGSLPSGWKSLGWAFAIVDQEGNLVAAARGVPPVWVDTIQGAELWALMMAMQHATLPEVVLTDCDSVRLGTKQPSEWAHSSKRRFARIWAIIFSQLDDAKDVVHWMPAHTSESAIGQKYCSDGYTVSEMRWCGNQICDLLAKQSADEHRVAGDDRHGLRVLEKKAA